MPFADSDFVHLHVHTDYSLLDGACRIDRLMDRAVELGMKALALTDHGNLYGAIDFYTHARDRGLKPLIGCEVYITEGSRLERTGRGEEGKSIFHLGLLARNLAGYQNLLKLVSDAHLKGFYYRPRADFETLARYADGLIAFSGCLAALIPQRLLHGRWDDARAAAARFIDIFGRENFFVEIQDHGLPEQRKIAPDLLMLAREFNLKVIGTNDVHYVRAQDAGPHDALLCIQTGAKLEDPDRMRFGSAEFYLKSRADMERLFGEVPGAILNTRAVAEMCDLAIPFPSGVERYPKYPLPPEAKVSRANYLKELCVAGLRRRYGVDYDAPPAAGNAEAGDRRPETGLPASGPQPPVSGLRSPNPPPPATADELRQRMDYELSIIDQTGYTDYFLVVWDFIHWAKSQGIPVGPGRGSGAGSLAAYLLGITDLDPLRFKLLFERFLNPERVSPPDFDIDFCMRRRGEVINYVRKKYGNDCVAHIITYGTLGAKMAIRDVARVHNMPYADADRLAKMIPDELNISLDDAVARSAELRAELERNPAAQRVVQQARVIEGMVRNTGKHAAGIIITDTPLDAYVPLTLQEGDVTVQYDMNAAAKLGLLKMDFLGLKTLTVIADAAENVRRTADPAFDIEKIPLDDARTFALLDTGRTTGVFQLESAGMQALCRQLHVSSIDEIIALIALFRPGPMEWIPEYIRGKQDPSAVTFPHPLIEDICRETYGVMVYQEQVMEAARVIAGYTLGGADVLRRAMGKKDPEAMAKERGKFVVGAKRLHNIDERASNAIFDILYKFAGYGFNKSHSAAYAILSYQTAWLKANYPVQFMAAVLSSELGNAEKVAHFIAECGAMGMSVLGPDANESREMFTPVLSDFRSGDRGVAAPTGDATPSGLRSLLSGHSSMRATADGEGGSPHAPGKIRFGLAGIKGVGEAAAQKIIAEREARGPYRDFEDFALRTDLRAINKRVFECLIKAGAFDFSGEPRGALFSRVDEFLSIAAARQRDAAAGQHSFLDMLQETESPAAAARPAGRQNDFTLVERLQYEKELLGFYVSGHPLNAYAGLAEAINTAPESELLDLADRAEFRLCGVATNVVKKLSKKDNRPWVAFTLVAKRASFQANLFADAYEDCAKNLAAEIPLVVQGMILRGPDGARVSVKECYPLETAVAALVRKITWLLQPDHPELPDFFRALRKAVDASYGDTRVAFAFLFEDRAAPVAEASPGLGWKPTAEKFQELRAHPAVAGAQVETRPLQSRETRKWGRRG